MKHLNLRSFLIPGLLLSSTLPNCGSSLEETLDPINEDNITLGSTEHKVEATSSSEVQESKKMPTLKNLITLPGFHKDHYDLLQVIDIAALEGESLRTYQKDPENIYKTLKQFIAFETTDTSSVEDKLIERIIGSLRFKDEETCNKIIHYIKNPLNNIAPIEGIASYKEQYEEIPDPILLKDVPTEGLSQNNSIVVTEAELRSSKLKELLEDNPNHQVVLMISKQKSIFANRYSGNFGMESKKVPECVKRLTIVGHEKIKTIVDQFLLSRKGLTHLDFKGLKNVTYIGGTFVYNCTDLTHINLKGLENVTHVGGDFLGICKGLKSLDLTGLKNLKTLRNRFLDSCTGLTHLDFNSLKNVTHIGNAFLYGCTGLTELSFTGLENVSEIGNFFLAECTGLTQLNLEMLENVIRIGSGIIVDYSLLNCTGIKTLRLGSQDKAPYKVIYPLLPADLKKRVVFDKNVEYYRR